MADYVTQDGRRVLKTFAKKKDADAFAGDESRCFRGGRDKCTSNSSTRSPNSLKHRAHQHLL